VTTRVASRHLSTTGVTLIELTVASLGLWLALLLRGTTRPRLTARLVVASLLEPGLTFLLINTGISRTSGSHAAVLIGTESVFIVAAAAWAARTRPAMGIMLGVVCAVIGVAGLSTQSGGSASALGDLLVVAGSASAATFVVLARPLLESMDALALTAYQFTIALAGVIAFDAVAAVGHHAPNLVPGDAKTAIVALANGIASATAFALYNWALPRISPYLAGTSLTAVPVIGTALSIVILGDALSLRTVIAGGVVVAGICAAAVAEVRAEVRADRDLPSATSCESVTSGLVGERDCV